MSGRYLKDIATVIRSKNAGPLLLTLDVILPDQETFNCVSASEILASRNIAKIYGVSHNEVVVTSYAQAYAIKVTLPRINRSGGPNDSDVYGAQQHVPLFYLQV